jgi:imidazolonepropionase
VSTRIFLNASQVVTCAGPPAARRGQALGDAGVLAGGAVVTDGARIVATGPEASLQAAWPDAEPVDCRRGVLLPGLVDSHSHAIFGKPRFEEQELRAAGRDYMAIAAAGGGIHASVRDLRARSEDDLVALALPRIRRLASYGTATLEVKSGYGLSVEDELKTLRAIRRLQDLTPIRLVPTFLGAHEIPLEARATPSGRRDYLDLLTREMIPRVAAGGLAAFADVFCEPGVFTVDESSAILGAARDAGLGLKLHADELEPSGGAELAARLGATSADHLAAISHTGIAALATAPTVAALLPGTLLFLGKSRQAPARALVAAGAAVALATDFNPGTSPTPNFPLILSLGVSLLRLSVAEVVVAATVNGAAALGLAHEIGQISPGFSADIALFEIDDVREVPYWYGDQRCRRLWVRGIEVGRGD